MSWGNELKTFKFLLVIWVDEFKGSRIVMVYMEQAMYMVNICEFQDTVAFSQSAHY